MERVRALCFLFLLLVASARAQAPADTAGAYRVYTAEGSPASLDAIVRAADTADVVLIGEAHNDPTAHALQLHLLQRAHEHFSPPSDTARPVALSLEMFARDVQTALNEYLASLITEEHFRAASRAWPNYAADYRPLIEYARTHGLSVTAANAPRRYVNRVAREGKGSLDALSAEAKRWLPPLPYADPSPAYTQQWRERMREAMPSDHGERAEENPHEPDTIEHGGHGSELAHLLEAQALWDATMAFSMAEHLMHQPEALVLHLSGSFHVARGTGIAEHLARYRPSARVLTVVIEPVEAPGAFDLERHADLGTFVILTEADRLRGAPPDAGPSGRR